MANTVTFNVIVTDKGTQKLVVRNLEVLGDAVSKVNAKHREAGKGATEFYDTQKKGIIGTANSTKSFSKLAETLGGQSSGIVGAYATLAANVFAVTAAFNALRGAAQVEQIFNGLTAAGDRLGLTLSITARNLKDVTGSAVSTEQSLRSTAQIISAGFGAKEVQALGQAAKDTSFALGRNLTDSLDRLTRGVVKLEPELLDELGIMTKLTESNVTYARQLNKTESQLTATEKRHGFLNAVIAEATLKFGGLSDAAGNSTAYDKLASTFNDLTNEVLGFINKVAKPLAGLFAGSPTSLLGGALLFASGIAKQLLPGLVNLSVKSAAASENLKKLAQEQAAGIKKIPLGPANFYKVTNAFKEGQDVTSKQLEAATKSVRGKLATYERQNAAANKALSEGKTLTEKQITRYNTNNQNTALLLHQQEILKEVVQTHRDAATQTKAADSIIAASNGELRTSYKLLTESVKEYGASELAKAESLAASRYAEKVAKSNRELPESTQKVVIRKNTDEKALSGVIAGYDKVVGAVSNINIGNLQTAATKVLPMMKTAAFAAATGIRALGAAFLNAIPLIGQIVFAIGLAQTAFEYFKSEGAKKSEKAFDDLATVISGVSGKVEELNRVKLSTASASSKAQQSIILEGNAVQELVEAYKNATRAQLEEQEAKKSGTGIASYGTALAESFKVGNQALASFRSGISQASPVLKGLQEQLIKADSFGSNTGFLKAAQSLDNLRKLAPETFTSIVKLNGGFEKLKNLSEEAATRELSSWIKQIGDVSGPAASKVQDLVESFKSGGVAMSDFLIAAVPTTQYDKVVSTFQNIEKNVNSLTDSLALGEVTAKDWQELFTNLDPNITRFFSATAQGIISTNVALEDNITALQKRKDLEGTGFTQYDQVHLDSLQKQFELSKNRLPLVYEEIKATEQLFRKNQETERSIKAQLQSLQAHIAANQINYSVTAAGEGARIDAENKAKDLQAESLRIQKTLIEVSIRQSEARLHQLETEVGITKAMTEQVVQAKLLAAQQELVAAKTAANTINQQELQNRTNPRLRQAMASAYPEKQAIADRVSRAQSEFDKASTVKASFREYEALEQTIQSSRDAIKSLNLEIDAILTSEINATEKLAAMNAKTIDIESARLKLIADQRSMLDSNIELEIKRNRILDGRSETLVDQLNIINATAKASASNAQIEYAQQRNKLLSSLQTAQAARTRATTDDDKRVNDQLQAYYTKEIDLLDSGYAIRVKNLDIDTQVQKLEKVIFDTRAEGITWQQDSLSYLEKSLSVQRDLNQAVLENAKLQREIARKRNGIDSSQYTDSSDTIAAALAAYQYAVRESALKKSLIDLEYALLDAQRVQLLEESRVRKAELLGAGMGGDNPAIQQLDSVITKLGSINIEPIVKAAKDAVDEGVKNAALNLELATTVSRTTGTLGKLAALIAQRRQESADREAAIEKARQAVPSMIMKVELDKRPANDNDVAIRNPIIASNDRLIEALDNLRKTTETNLRGAGAPQVGGGDILAAGNYAKSLGLTPWENPNFGGVKHQHRGAGHAEGRAIDIYSKPDDGEWNDMATRQQYFKLADKYIGDGLKVIFGPAGTKYNSSKYDHLDHLHVEAEKAGVKAVQVIMQAATDAGVKVAQEPPERAALGIHNIKDPVASTNTILKQTPIKTLTQADLKKADDKEALERKLAIVRDFTREYETSVSQIRESLLSLGPQGEAVVAISDGMINITSLTATAFEKIADHSASTADKVTAVADVLSSALGTVQSVVAATANARVAAIDKEIAAEQNRDGKSADSVLKIQALEKKKDSIAKKAFNTNKKLMMAQAVISTASGIAQALSYGPIAGPILAALIGAMGAAQIAIIAGTSYQSSASAPNTNFSTPTLSIGKQGDTVDVAKQNNNIGGELGYLRGARGVGTNSSNYAVVNSAYGGNLNRGYGNTAYAVGEKGPEILTPDTPIQVTPMNDNNRPQSIHAEFHVNTIDSKGLAEMLDSQKGNIISMLRGAANASGQRFLEDVDVNVYTRPNVSRL